MKQIKLKPIVESTFPPKDPRVLWGDVDEQTGDLLSIKRKTNNGWEEILDTISSLLPNIKVLNKNYNTDWINDVDYVDVYETALSEEPLGKCYILKPEYIEAIYDEGKEFIIIRYESNEVSGEHQVRWFLIQKPHTSAVTTEIYLLFYLQDYYSNSGNPDTKFNHRYDAHLISYKKIKISQGVFDYKWVLESDLL